jgi:nucleotide-binding universal stress UspA family protein
MYRKIVVPLDGSTFAEQALSHAQTLAVPAESEIHLISVAPMLDDQGLAVVDLYPIYVYRDYLVDQGQETQRIRGELQDYLNQVAAKLQAAGFKARSSIRFGQPADEILAYAQDQGCDIIVMSTHGRSGVGRWVYGSVADKVLRGSKIPVLLVRVQESTK